MSKRYTTPFGSARGPAPSTWPDDKRFLDKPEDTGTNLTHIGAREYDASLGQFISIDPALSLDQHQSLNGYSYANNSPLTFSDPTGLESCGSYGYCGGGGLTNGDHIEDGGGGGGGGGKQWGNGGSGSKPGPFVSVITPLPYIPPTIAAPEYAKERACQFDPVLSCNPEDAVHGGEKNGPLLGVAALWALGMLDPEMTYGEDSGVARDVMKSDLTATHRNEIGRLFYEERRMSGPLTSNSIGSKDSDGQTSQLREDLTAIATHDKRSWPRPSWGRTPPTMRYSAWVETVFRRASPSPME